MFPTSTSSRTKRLFVFNFSEAFVLWPFQAWWASCETISVVWHQRYASLLKILCNVFYHCVQFQPQPILTCSCYEANRRRWCHFRATHVEGRWIDWLCWSMWVGCVGKTQGRVLSNTPQPCCFLNAVLFNLCNRFMRFSNIIVQGTQLAAKILCNGNGWSWGKSKVCAGYRVCSGWPKN